MRKIYILKNYGFNKLIDNITYGKFKHIVKSKKQGNFYHGEFIELKVYFKDVTREDYYMFGKINPKVGGIKKRKSDGTTDPVL